MPENNIEYLISAYNKIKTDLKLAIVGDSTYQLKYVKYLKNNDNPNIVFTGFLRDGDYLEICSNAYVFVETTEASGTHPALLDAMGLGNCVLVNNIPTNLEVITNAGLSYDGTKKDADLKNKLEWLLNNPEKLNEYKIKAIEHVKKNYSWDTVTDLYEKLYCGYGH